MATVLVLADLSPAAGPPSSLGARVCAAITALDPPPPVVVVAHGALARLLPAVALAQRSAHRPVAAYVLIEPDIPPVTDSWPDAPVTVVTDDESGEASRQARLRGWDVVTGSQYQRWQPPA